MNRSKKPSPKTQATDAAPVPREELRQLVSAAIDSEDAALMEIAAPVVARLREAWMSAFVELMCEEIKARRA